MIRVLVVGAALGSALGCTAFHSVAAGPTPGEFYFSAQRSFLGIPGKPYIVRCQGTDHGASVALACDRLLSGKDASQISPAFPPHADFIVSAPTTPPAPTTAPMSAPLTPSPVAPPPPPRTTDRIEATQLLIYDVLVRPYPKSPSEQRSDYAAIGALLAAGFTAREIRDTMQDIDARTAGTRTVTELATMVLDDGPP